MEGAELSARFALAPNSKGYCGRLSFRNALAAYLEEKTGNNLQKLQFELSKFTAHYAYLELIAKENGRWAFDYSVAEAFWLGNALLKDIGREKIGNMVRSRFVGAGKLSEARAQKLAAAIPEGMLAHHTFHVLHLHTITGVIEPTDSNADLCRPSWGKILRIRGGSVLVRTQKLARKNGKLSLVPCTKVWKATCAGLNLVKGAKAGDIVASHWGFAVMKLNASQRKKLESATLHNLKITNRH